MSRIDRRNWTNEQFGASNQQSLFDLMDDVMKIGYRITDEEYDHLCEVLTEAELDLVITEEPTFAQKRQMIELLNRHIAY
jgi:hypothetical protein